MDKLVYKGVIVECECGDHLVDMGDKEWGDKNMEFYSCNKCDKPLVVKSDTGEFYYIGGKVNE